MSEHGRRPSLVAKPTHIRYQKRHATQSPGLQAPPRTLDSLIAGIGYAGIASYVYANFRKLAPWELAGISLGSLTFGYGLYDLGQRNGMIHGANFALRGSDEEARNGEKALGDEDSWKGEFRGKEFEELKIAEKIAWLRLEQQRIRDLQEDEQLKCGQAYIAKEEADVAYEKHGAYGGPDWKRYAEADSECRNMYQAYEKQQKRLSQIRKEINDLNEQI